MNEEIEYAEMLEIPVSTVNVVRKKNRRKRARRPDDAPALSAQEDKDKNTDAFLRDSVIAQVNDRMGAADGQNAPSAQSSSASPQITADAQLFAEGANSEGYLAFDPEPDRLQTVRLYASGEARAVDGDGAFDVDRGFDGELNDAFDGGFANGDGDGGGYTNDGARYAMNGRKRPSRGLRILLNTELALACALCGAIFFTNVFVPDSAINTFFRAMNTPKQETAVKHYSEFELSPIVSLRSDAELNLSPTGVLSFTDDCCVYPAANGRVKEVVHTSDGLYTVKIGYTDTFTGVFFGLDQVYYAVGDEVKANVPVGYTAGNAEVQVTMYSDGNLLNCFELTEENCLAWIDQAEE